LSHTLERIPPLASTRHHCSPSPGIPCL
jgi:hypothetical protein